MTSSSYFFLRFLELVLATFIGNTDWMTKHFLILRRQVGRNFVPSPTQTWQSSLKPLCCHRNKLWKCVEEKFNRKKCWKKQKKNVKKSCFYFFFFKVDRRTTQGLIWMFPQLYREPDCTWTTREILNMRIYEIFSSDLARRPFIFLTTLQPKKM